MRRRRLFWGAVLRESERDREIEYECDANAILPFVSNRPFSWRQFFICLLNIISLSFSC